MDLMTYLQKTLIKLIEELQKLRNLFPYFRIIWSDILHRTKYDCEYEPGIGNKYTIYLNTNAHQTLDAMPVAKAKYVKFTNI